MDGIIKYFDEMKEIADKINKDDIKKIVDVLYKARIEGKTIFIMGNGGSASTATHMVCDLAKCTIVETKKRFKVIGLNDNIPWVSALTNDDGWENIYLEQLKNNFKNGDIVIGFSVHGGSGSDKAGVWSQNLLKAMQFVKDNGGIAIGFSGFDGGAMKVLADYCIVVPKDSTPHVESFHLALEHLICDEIKKKIEGE